MKNEVQGREKDSRNLVQKDHHEWRKEKGKVGMKRESTYK